MESLAGNTLNDFLIELGEAVGALDSNGDIPAGGYERAKLIRKLNRGLVLLFTEKPTGWNVLERHVSLSLKEDGTSVDQLRDETGAIDPTRLLMPAGITGQPSEGFTWHDLTGQRSGSLEATSVERVARLLTADEGVTGYPRMIALEPHHPKAGEGSQAMRFLARVYPEPDQDYTIRGKFALGPTPMLLLADRSPFGPMLDEAVLAAGKWAWVQDDPQDPRFDAWKLGFLEAAARAIRIDAQLAPDNLGALNGESDVIDSHTINDLAFNGLKVNP